MDMERREYNRYRLGVPVIFSWRDRRHAPHEGIGLTHDMSVRGVFVLTTSPAPLESHVKVKAFPPPGRSAVAPLRTHGQGRVVRVEAAHRGQPRAGFAVAGERLVLRRAEEYQ
jgi:hypothetical protein